MYIHEDKLLLDQQELKMHKGGVHTTTTLSRTPVRIHFLNMSRANVARLRQTLTLTTASDKRSAPFDFVHFSLLR